MLPTAHGNIDHFLIGPNGLFVIETKNYSGNVKCNGDQRFFNGHGTQSPGRQAKGNAVAVRKSLEPVFFAHSPEMVRAIVHHIHSLQSGRHQKARAVDDFAALARS
jgi:hypothetical protein